MNEPEETHGHATHGHATKTSPPSAISNQLRDELIRILQSGDTKQDGAFTIAVATQVEKFTSAARDILMTENLAKNDLNSLMLMQKPMGVPWSSNFGSSFIGDPLTVNNENFGVQAIRQLVESARTMNESPEKLVQALAAARAHNLTDVAESLEKKLGVLKKTEDVEGTAARDRSTSAILANPTDLYGRPLQ